MPRPDFIPTGLPSPEEVRERHHDLDWLHETAEPRRPERNRGRSDYGDAPKLDQEREKRYP